MGEQDKKTMANDNKTADKVEPVDKTEPTDKAEPTDKTENINSDILAGVTTKEKNSADFKLLDNGYKISIYTINGKTIYMEWLDPTIGWKLLELARVELAEVIPNIDILEVLENNSQDNVINNIMELLKFSPTVVESFLKEMTGRLYLMKDDKKVKCSELNSHLFFSDPFEVYELLFLFIKLHFIQPLSEKNLVSSLKQVLPKANKNKQ